MDDAQDPNGRRPTAVFWIVSLLSLLWNSLGAYDYSMSRMRDMDYLNSMSAGQGEAILRWIDGMPLIAQIAWPLGVWGSVAGSILLLLRSRYAAAAFLVSLIGAFVSFAVQMTTTIPAALDTPMNTAMPLVIMALVVGQWWYARRMRNVGVLR